MPIYSDIDIELEKQTDGDIERNDEYLAINNSLRNIFNTVKGERRMLPTFGCNIYEYLFEPIDEITAYNIGEDLLNAITYWETRITVKQMKVIPKPDSHLFDISVQYSIKENPTIIKEFSFILKRN